MQEAIGDGTMKDAKNFLRTAGMILLGVFVVAVAAPIALKASFGVFGLALGIVGVLISFAVMLIKVAVVLAIGYLVLVGIRALRTHFAQHLVVLIWYGKL